MFFTVLYRYSPRHNARVAGVTLSEIAAVEWADGLARQNRDRWPKYRASVVADGGALVWTYGRTTVPRSVAP